MKLVNVQQLATFLQVHKRTVYRLVKKGAIPRPVHKPGDARWDLEEVEKVLRADPAKNPTP